MKKYFCSLVIVGIFLSLVVTLPSGGQENEPPVVVVTIYPMFEFARMMLGDMANLMLVIGKGDEAHSYEPTLADIEQFLVADVFIYNGSGFEDPWVDPLLNGGLLDPRSQIIIEATAQLNAYGRLLPAPAPDDESFMNDPHVWLDPVLTIGLVDEIEAGLLGLFAETGDTVRNNADQLRDELRHLDTEFSEGLDDCESRYIVSSHQFLNYMGERYGFQTMSPSGLEPQEPSIQTIEEMIDFAQENNITAFFSEATFDADESGLSAIAEATGAQIFSINPLESVTQEDFEAGVTYFDVMRQNLATFQEALGCE
jgi:zinc transport system substrate-binding protein